VVEAQLSFSCVAFTVAQVAKRSTGRRLIELGSRRLRRDLVRE